MYWFNWCHCCCFHRDSCCWWRDAVLKVAAKIDRRPFAFYFHSSFQLFLPLFWKPLSCTFVVTLIVIAETVPNAFRNVYVALSVKHFHLTTESVVWWIYIVILIYLSIQRIQNNKERERYLYLFLWFYYTTYVEDVTAGLLAPVGFRLAGHLIVDTLLCWASDTLLCPRPHWPAGFQLMEWLGQCLNTTPLKSPHHTNTRGSENLPKTQWALQILWSNHLTP